MCVAPDTVNTTDHLILQIIFSAHRYVTTIRSVEPTEILEV